jgi:hypothetical protein
MESLLEMRPSVLAFSSSFCMAAEGTQLVVELVAFPLAMLFFTARCFTRIYEFMLRGRAGRKDRQWWRRRKERAGKKYKSPLSPYIPSR